MHFSVLLKETIEYLDIKSGKNIIDATLGGGGHSFPILERILPRGKILGIEADPKAFNKIKKRINKLNLEDNFIVVNKNFVNLKEIVEDNNFNNIDGIIFDLGLSTDLIEESDRGFSFSGDEILDMRFNPYSEKTTAAQILNQLKEKELRNIFKTYGGEKYSGRIAKTIIQERKKEKIIMTSQLRDIVKKALGSRYHIKSLARIFQALRIVVNSELENLQKALEQSLEILSPGGRIVVISYHSGEDRIVKHFFKDKEGLEVLTKKPILPSELEINRNKSSRSAKLRACKKINL